MQQKTSTRNERENKKGQFTEADELTSLFAVAPHSKDEVIMHLYLSEDVKELMEADEYFEDYRIHLFNYLIGNYSDSDLLSSMMELYYYHLEERGGI